MAQARSKQSAAKRIRRRPRRRTVSRRSARTTEVALVAYAHDIRTALTGILALGELLASSNLGAREREWAAGIKESAQHLASLTTLMIDAAKSDAGALKLQQAAFRPRHLLEAVADSLSARAEMKGLATEVTIADNLPEQVVGDAARLRAALENLIDNAVKFTARGVVRLDVRAAPATRGRVRMTVEVADSGIGLRPAEIKRLFRPFAQANAGIARRYGGAGLGLATVKAMAKAMGGDLTVTSKSGRGSTFRFSAVLPVASGTAAGQAPAREARTPSRRLAVLCAEDNPYGRVILNTILSELGHHTDFVSTGEEAVAAAARGYDVLLMDVTLPGIDGVEATRRIRALGGAVGRTPVIGISGRSGSGDEDAARTAGMDAYLRKPISPSALAQAMTTALRR